MTMKIEVPLEKAHRLISHGPTVLITSINTRRIPNIITVAWVTPISKNPPMVVAAIGKETYSCECIKRSGEFVINIPSINQLKEVRICGSISGKKVNKFSETNLKQLPSLLVKPPRIEKCIGHLECKVENMIEPGDHILFIGRVVAVTVNQDLFDDHWKLEEKRAKTVHHLGGEYFTTMSEVIVGPPIAKLKDLVDE